MNTLASSSRQSRLSLYRNAGLGTLAIAGIATSVDASVVFINYGNQILADSNTADTTFTGFAFDLNGDGTNDIRFAQRISGANGIALVTIPATGTSLNIIGVTSNTYNYPSRLAAGANIGAAGPFITLAGTLFGAQGSLANGAGGVYPNSAWNFDSTPGFLGINFQVGGQTVYGWVQIAIAPNTAGQPRAITLISAAYENVPGVAITAGAIPEPTTTVGLLALGATGLLAHRRAKRKQVAA